MLIELGSRGWDLGVLRSEAVGRSEKKLMLQEVRREICPTNQEASRNSRRGDRHSRFSLTGYRCNINLVTIAYLTLHDTPLYLPMSLALLFFGNFTMVPRLHAYFRTHKAHI